MSSKKRLTFIKSPFHEHLTQDEASYWLDQFRRILKIGIELEYNLPEKETGICVGNSQTCVCKNFGKPTTSCWKECALTNSNVCSIKGDKNCTKSPQDICPAFVSKCLVCDDFVVDCASCSFLFDPTKNPESIRALCTNEFKPSGNYGCLSKSGVHEVKTDHSLLGKDGIEILTTGRRVTYWSFYNMLNNIMTYTESKGAFSNERCSIHMHLLTSFYSSGCNDKNNNSSEVIHTNELEKPIPAIILSNFHQLMRKYQNALTWMSTGLPDMDHLTRWEKFRVSILPISATKDPFCVVKDKAASIGYKNKYSLVNYVFLKLESNNYAKNKMDRDISKLQIELRVMDGSMSPSATAAMACLYYAIMLRAVELSKYGILDLDDVNFIPEAQAIKDTLLNNVSSWEDASSGGRFSNTSKVTKHIPELIEQSFDMLHHLKHILQSVGPCYPVLEKLAESPCSLRLMNGKSWSDVEKELKVMYSPEDSLLQYLNRIIDLREVTGKNSKHHWISDVTEIITSIPIFSDYQIGELSSIIDTIIDGKINCSESQWSPSLGTVINNA